MAAAHEDEIIMKKANCEIQIWLKMENVEIVDNNREAPGKLFFNFLKEKKL